MKNLTNQILTLANGEEYFIVRQALFKGKTYFLGAGVTKEEKLTNEFLFFESIEDGDKFMVKEVKDPNLIETLARSIRVDI